MNLIASIFDWPTLYENNFDNFEKYTFCDSVF